jgi:hypothetical protein
MKLEIGGKRRAWVPVSLPWLRLHAIASYNKILAQIIG